MSEYGDDALKSQVLTIEVYDWKITETYNGHSSGSSGELLGQVTLTGNDLKLFLSSLKRGVARSVYYDSGAERLHANGVLEEQLPFFRAAGEIVLFELMPDPQLPAESNNFVQVLNI